MRMMHSVALQLIGAVRDARQDTVYSVRSFVSAPVFLVTSVAVMAAGIGATVLVFSFVNSLLFHSLPYPEARQIVSIVREFPGGMSKLLDGRMIALLNRHVRTLEYLAVSTPSSGLTLVLADSVHHVSAQRVSSNYFRALNVSPVMGRHPDADDERADAVVLSHSLWRQHFGGNSRVVGATVELGGRSRRVVGVMPVHFMSFPEADVWDIVAPPQEGGFNFQLIGRLAQDVTIDGAGAELRSLLVGIRETSGDVVADDVTLDVRSYQAVVGDDVAPVLAMLSVAVGFVLILACVNTGGLLAARLATRERETVTRLALGCTHGRLMRQFFVEGLLLASLGAGVGTLVAHAIVGALAGFFPGAISAPAGGEASVFGFTVGTVVAAAVLCGFGPMLYIARFRTRRNFSCGWSGPVAHRRTQQVLVAVQACLCVVLLVGTGLLVRMMIRSTNVELGFEPRNAVTAAFSMQGDAHASAGEAAAYYERVLARLESLSGLESAAVVNNLPVETGLNLPIHVPSDNCPECTTIGTDRIATVEWRYVTSEYLRVMGIPLAAGRALASMDRAGAPPVAVVNQAFVDKFFGVAAQAIGETVRVYQAVPALVDGPRRIVGVVGNVLTGGLSRPPRPMVLVPVDQVAPEFLNRIHEFFEVKWVVRTSINSERLIRDIEDVIRLEDRQIALGGFRPMEQIVADAVSGQRFRAAVLGLFGSFGLGLVAVGVYGLMWSMAASRFGEVAVRLALGATPGKISSTFMIDAMVPVGTGLVVGLGAAVVGVRLVGSVLFGVESVDVGTLVAVTGLLTVVTTLSSYCATSRASGQEIVRTLRGGQDV